MSEVLSWARRWARRPTASDHELLEISRTASLTEVRGAYHQLARFAHPDLHRTALSGEQLEEVTATFARVSNAYAMMSSRLRKAGAVAEPPARGASDRAPWATRTPAPAAGAPAPAPVVARPASHPKPAASAAPSAASRGPAGGARPTTLPIGPSNAMSPRALVHYRRAELSMRRGATVEAVLHLRLAIATDPQSSFLRKALADLGTGG